MTKQEAIDLLDNLIGFVEDNHDSDYDEALKMAIEALGGNGVAQERKYTFGNDEFSLEAAYHDCKLVFDGITDDNSFQEADTGLILYYANEIIYALHEALSCSEEPNRSEPLTDKEQRIFLAAMGREREVCKQVDEEWRDCREPYEDSLVMICNEIERKVKGALWNGK